MRLLFCFSGFDRRIRATIAFSDIEDTERWNPGKKPGGISKADARVAGRVRYGSTGNNEVQKAAAICQSRITEARNASHTASTNAPRPGQKVLTQGGRAEELRSRFPPSRVPIVYSHRCGIRGMRRSRVPSLSSRTAIKKECRGF